MNAKTGAPLDRPSASPVLEETRKRSRQAFDLLSPGARMEAAFTLSMDARKLRIAALRAQGRRETEIRQIMSERRR